MSIETIRPSTPTDDPRPEDKTERQIDDALADSFPASDPPSHTPMTGIGETPTGDSGHGTGPIATKLTGPSCIISYIGESERSRPVIDMAIEAASKHGARLIFYDAAAASRFGSPLPTFWSGTRDEQQPELLGPGDLEAAGRAFVAAIVIEARSRGIDAHGWLPSSRGAHDLAAYADVHHADLIILPSDLEHVPFLDRFVHGTSGVSEIIKESSVPVVTVDVTPEAEKREGGVS